MAAVSRYDAFISYSHKHDAALGPALQAELERLAKPWYRMRALRIFLACYCSLPVSLPGKPSDPGTSLRVPPGCAGDITGRLAAQLRHECAFLCMTTMNKYVN
jgi:hypothetical protein